MKEKINFNIQLLHFHKSFQYTIYFDFKFLKKKLTFQNWRNNITQYNHILSDIFEANIKPLILLM